MFASSWLYYTVKGLHPHPLQFFFPSGRGMVIFSVSDRGHGGFLYSGRGRVGFLQAVGVG